MSQQNKNAASEQAVKASFVWARGFGARARRSAHATDDPSCNGA
jgi:hypothetical protein